jgi:hypothetical protein
MRRHLEGRRHPGFFSPSPLHFFYIQGELQRLLAKGLGFGGLSIQMGFRGKARHAGRTGAGLRPGGSARERRPRRRRNRGRQEGGGRGVKKKKKRSERSSSTAAGATGDAEGGRGRGERLRWENSPKSQNAGVGADAAEAPRSSGTPPSSGCRRLLGCGK